MRKIFNSALLAALSIAGSVYAQSVTVPMVDIQAGEFMMGSPASEFERQKDETQHRVAVSSFHMSQYEVSQALYESVMGNNPSAHVGKNLPVENLTWYDAIRFCNALSQKEG